MISFAMTNLAANYYAELDILCIIILCLLFFKTVKSNFIPDHKRTFECVLAFHAVFAASDLVWIFNNGFIPLLDAFPNYGIIISYVLNSVNVIFSGLTGLSWLIFSEAVQNHLDEFARKKIKIALIPVLVLAAMTFTTGRTRIMFYIDEQGEFFRGRGYAGQVFISMGYIAVASFLASKRVISAKSLSERTTSLTIVRFAIGPFCAVALQMLFPKMQLLFLGTILALLSAYINLQQSLVLTDPLTGLNNRMQLDRMLNTAIQTWSGKTELYLMLIDADDFKKVNDVYGHRVGDKVLVHIADALRENCDDTDFICRYGGDEFVVLHRALPGQDCSEFIGGVNKTLASCDAPCHVSVSVGCCRYTPDIKTLDEFVNTADEDLYRIKYVRKSSK